MNPTEDTPMRYKVALSLVKGMGAKGTRYFLNHIESLEDALLHPQQLRLQLPRLSESILQQLSSTALLAEADRILEACEREHIVPHFYLDDDYPELLYQCPDAPIILYVRGSLQSWEHLRGLSIVGTRNATSYGRTTVSYLIPELAQRIPSLLITSGLAYGIDIQAHRSALEAGISTIAVLAHGLDMVYPAAHRREAQQMLERGAWVSEYAPGVKAHPSSFLARNRIIAGLTKGTIVIEAGGKSGALSTAHLALDYDREVFAVPGRVEDSMSLGCHQLIEESRAHLLYDIDELITELGWSREESSPRKEPSPALAHRASASYSHPILRLLDEQGTMTLDELARRLTTTVAAMSDQLFELELEGLIEAQPGGAYRIA